MAVNRQTLASPTVYITEGVTLRFKNAGRGNNDRGLVLSADHQEALDRFLLSLRKAETTRRIYRNNLRHFLGFIDASWPALPLESLTREHVETWVNFISREGGYGAATIRSMVMTARLFCRYLIERDALDADPFVHVRDLPRAAAPDVDIITAEDVQVMLTEAKRDKSVWGKRDRALIGLLFYGGMRRTELLSIRPSDINWSKETVHIERGKGGDARTVGLNWQAMSLLDDYEHARKRYIAGKTPMYKRRRLEAADRFWLSQGGGFLGENGLTTMLQSLAKRAGITKPVHAHAWRHSSATHDADAGMEDTQMRDKYGWSPSSAMPWRYSRQTLRARTIARSRGLRGDDGVKL